MRALVLTEERAEALGYQGPGPFTFGAVFPGEYRVGEPVALRYLGFGDDSAAADAFAAAFADLDDDAVPLELTDVGYGEGVPPRINHALSEGDPALGAAAVAAAEEDVGVTAIRTHKDADAVAAELGLTFPDGATVAEKTAAIDQYRGTAADAGGELVPAPGAEGTVPAPAEPA